MAIYFTSDTHFSHKNSMRYCGRPFFTVEQCDEAMIERWNSVVKPEDTVYHLGDVSMKTEPIKRLLPRLNGKKILIVGNHDLMYDYFIKTRGQKFIDRMYKEYTEAGFVEIHKSGYMLPGWVNIRLSHFPTRNVEDNKHNDKHDLAKPIDDGCLNICGHVHQNWLTRGNNVNVGVDVQDFTPVSLDRAQKLWIQGAQIHLTKKFSIAIWKTYHTLIWWIKKLVSF